MSIVITISVKLESLVIMGNVSILEETSECCELLGSQKWCTGPCFQDRRSHQPFLRYTVRDIQRIPKGGSENQFINPQTDVHSVLIHLYLSGLPVCVQLLHISQECTKLLIRQSISACTTVKEGNQSRTWKNEQNFLCNN